tara:strand:+ start:280 stop:783 length:504 start_codon:yes stop_codon:yes gene_type:complete
MMPTDTGLRGPAAVTRVGGCECGDTRYQFVGEPLFIHACHCTLCQRITGSAFQISMLMTKSQFSLSKGQPAVWHLKADSGNVRPVFFCERCGCQLYGDAPGRGPEIMWIQSGTLDDTTWFSPRAHIWTSSMQSWLTLPVDVPAFDTNYDAVKVWPASSLARMQASPG